MPFEFKDESQEDGSVGNSPTLSNSVFEDTNNPLSIFNGEGEIRTPVGYDPKPDFESGAFNRSATSPGAHKLLYSPKF